MTGNDNDNNLGIGDPNRPDPPTDGNMAAFDGGDLELDLDDDFEVVDSSVSCTDCEHFPVCAIYSGIAPMLAEFQQNQGTDEPPFPPEKLAFICSYYQPADDGAVGAQQ